MGNVSDAAFASLGYLGSNGVNYSVYGFGSAYQSGIVGGRATVPQNQHIGLGITGGVMGGWVHGNAYGMHVRGERSSLYVDGASFNTQPTVQLIDTPDNQRAVTYAVSSPSPDVYVRGKGSTTAGRAQVKVQSSFLASISKQRSMRDPSADVVITVTPLGESKGLYIAAMSDDGFEVRENGGGLADVAFSWIAMAKRVDVDTNLPSEVLADNFDTRMRAVMTNDMSPESAQPIWWDGDQVRFDKAPAQVPVDAPDVDRPK